MANRKDRESIRPSAEPWTDLYQESTLSVVLGPVGTAQQALQWEAGAAGPFMYL